MVAKSSNEDHQVVFSYWISREQRYAAENQIYHFMEDDSGKLEYLQR
jgi:hypothetical protein